MDFLCRILYNNFYLLPIRPAFVRLHFFKLHSARSILYLVFTIGCLRFVSERFSYLHIGRFRKGRGKRRREENLRLLMGGFPSRSGTDTRRLCSVCTSGPFFSGRFSMKAFRLRELKAFLVAASCFALPEFCAQRGDCKILGFWVSAVCVCVIFAPSLKRLGMRVLRLWNTIFFRHPFTTSSVESHTFDHGPTSGFTMLPTT